MSEAASSRGLRVPLERLQRLEPIRYWQSSVRALDLPQAGSLRVGEVSVDDEELVEIDLVLDRVSEGVAVAGTLTTQWSAECARCLCLVREEMIAEVEELFEEREREGESYLLGEEFLDLEPMVRELILLELPIGVVRCSKAQECENLAPEYLSEDDSEEVDSSPPKRDPRWAALDQITFDD